LSVRSALLDTEGTARLVTLAVRLQHAGPLPKLVADTFQAQLCALRGDLEHARNRAYALLARLANPPTWLRESSPAAVSAISATLYIGVGMIEAQYALHAGRASEIVETFRALSARARELGATLANNKDVVSEAELELAADKLNQAMHLARGERFRADLPLDTSRSTSVTGMHQQFEVWRNAIDCHQSLRALDVASLRRTVETFTHYVTEQPGLVLWLELARAHLSLSLGKPREALVTYSKWLDQIQPGTNLAWDTLYYGYADALIGSGQAAQAREWLMHTLAHPILQEAKDTTSGVTLEAQLAWAEAECGMVEGAKLRLQGVTNELNDTAADHPLVLGFVHEIAARIAHRSRDEAALAEHLSEMKRWYTLTRNQALMMRGQRTHDSLSEVRTNPRLLDSDGDRNVVTKVTTRRDNNLE